MPAPLQRMRDIGNTVSMEAVNLAVSNTGEQPRWNLRQGTLDGQLSFLSGQFISCDL
jgi:hypothetical protein